jgi:TonB family protein
MSAAAPKTVLAAKVVTLEKPKISGPPQAQDALGEDPVMAELEKAESEPQGAPPAPSVSAPVFSAYAEKPKKSGARGPLVAVLVLALLGGGIYAAWMTQPAFREIAQPQVDRVLALAGMAQPGRAPAAASATAKPAAAPVPAVAQTTPAPATNASLPQDAEQNGTVAPVPPPTSSAATATPTSAVLTSVAPASAAPGSVAPAASPATQAANPPAPVERTKTDTKKTDSDKTAASKTAAADAKTSSATSDAELPWERTTVILSSKGAEKRLTHSVQPKYPASVRLSGAEETMVLKTLVDESGKVAGARLVEGNAALAESAIKAVKQWRYRPYIRDGKALSFQTIVLIDFQHN